MRLKPAAGVLLALVLSAFATSAAALPRDSTTSSATTIKTVHNKTLNKTIVVDGKGWTVYLFTADTSGVPTCTAALLPSCPEAWPPVKSSGQPLAGAGVIASKLGTVKRTDGRGTQVTYNGHPLYYYRGAGADKKPGDAKGQGFSKLWYVLSPKGTPIRK